MECKVWFSQWKMRKVGEVVRLMGLKVGPNGVGLSSRAWGGGKLSLLEWGVLGVKVSRRMVGFGVMVQGLVFTVEEGGSR